jgi:hypothetical protein
MQRRLTMVLTLAVPLAAYSWVASAQTAKPKTTHAAVAATASASAASSATPTAASAAVTGPVPPPAVSVDMTSKPPDTAMNGATYSVRLRDLEQRVDELKDQIRRSHTRLALLSDTIIGGGTAGSRAEVDFENEMSNAFELTRALIVIDGQVQYNRQDETGALADQKSIPIYTGTMPPGDHTIQVALTFQGNGYGVFSYMKGIKFEVKSSHAFTAVEGKALTVTATAYEKGGATTPLEQRPDIQWHERFQPLSAVAATAPVPATQPASAATLPAGGASATGTLSIGGGKK